MKKVNILIFGFFLVVFFSCDTKIEKGVLKSDFSKDVKMVTSYGTIIMRLSDETPKHRNNFIRLVNEKFYDSISFHRIIETFLIQTGNYKTKPLSLQLLKDSLSFPKIIPSEFKPNLFHKRGALNAAREGDYSNPNRASHGSQFTIIQGLIQTDTTLLYSEKLINKWHAKNNVINRPIYKDDFTKYAVLSKKIDEINDSTTILNKEQQVKIRSTFTELNNKIASYNLDSLAVIELTKMKKYSYPTSHRKIYKTIGGAPHLDQNYTIFGEVITGMNVVDSIASAITNKTGKPINDIYIITTKMIKRTL